MSQRIFFAGTQKEAAHHAAPLTSRLDVTLSEPKQILLTAQPGDLVIFYSEHFDRFRDACRQLREKQIATLYMIDGILEWRNAWENRSDEPACPYTMRPVLSHKVACIGASQARVIASWGNPEKIEVVGIPRLETLQQNKPTAVDNQRFRLLVMTAKCPAFTEDDRAQVIQSLIDLKQWITNHPKLNGKTIEVCWRLTGDLERVIGVPNQLGDISGTDLPAVLSQVDAVISTPSTAALEAQLLDIPTAILDYTNSPKYVDSAWAISANRHIGPTLAELANPSEAKCVLQRYLLRDALYLESSATDRLTELIQGMLDTSQKCLEESRPLDFPIQMLTPLRCPSASDIGFKSQLLFKERPEFSEADHNVVQTELAHARREIQHLQREIEQLQTELGQAHQIFEQIQNHPIAGPVIRTREKLLGLLSSLKEKNASRYSAQSVNPKAKPKPKPNS